MQHTIDFVKTYYPHAFLIAQKKGYDAVAILAQAALESDWGRRVKGNNFFGIKDTDGINGNEQEIFTTEVLTESQVKKRYSWFKKLKDFGNGLFSWSVKDNFRKYDSPWESFLDYSAFIERNSRYVNALKVKGNGLEYLRLVSEAGYATGLGYYKTLAAVYGMITVLVAKHIKL